MSKTREQLIAEGAEDPEAPVKPSQATLEKIEKQLRAIVSKQEADTRRLDWMEKHPHAVTFAVGYGGSLGGWSTLIDFVAEKRGSLREAIDAAIAAEESAKEPK